jgi:hypothetical protein
VVVSTLENTVADYLEDARRLNARAFADTYPYPVLLRRGDMPATTSKFGTDNDAMETTRAVLNRGGPVSVTRAKEDLALVVIAVRKRPGNLYEEAITVGRSPTNDIELPYPDISKLHAYFTCSSDGSTYLDEVGLTPKHDVPLKSPCSIRLAGNHLRFLASQDFYELLGALKS